MADLLARVRASLAGRYTIERELGRGGMATVYLARDLKHDRPVALKVLRPELAAVLGAERFLREIRLTAQLQHPHILTLIDSGEADGILYWGASQGRGIVTSAGAVPPLGTRWVAVGIFPRGLADGGRTQK